MSEDLSVLEECEIQLVDEEQLYRQIPSFNYDSQSGRPAAHAFGPSDSDKGKASYSRASVVSAEESFEWHNAKARSTSVSVWRIDVSEVIAAGIQAVDDNACEVLPGDPKRSPGHCFVDFRKLSKAEQRVVRAVLFTKALAHKEQWK
jgi:hypothetical protein